ncbi:Tip attachment protein J [Vibrio phage 2.117.O._10N.261.45.E9]|nr:tip attachment protein J [Vibrio phage 1.117.O._10N.261.45.E9]AUR95448.1 Tip attachment protein J [Vibrio phage 1.207.B._10N.222.51.C2]AUS02339.1 Tip attachment protein J [Vibrio phage 2.117.O._10N.261.45.E9]
MGGKKKKQTVGYRYHLGMHMVFCHGPIDAVTRIRVDEKTVWSGSATGGSIYINAAKVFGGDPPAGEGGISGTVDILSGSSSQTKNSYLQRVLGATIPAFRGVASLVLNQCYIGNTPYLKTWGLTARRIGATGWYGKATIASAEGHQDMNPVHIIYECITNTAWGMGSDPTLIDNGNFKGVADRLYDEGFGLSILWDGSKAIQEFLVDVMSHIDAVLYIDRRTGLFNIKLIRDDYVIGDLDVLDEDHIIEVTDFTKPLVSDLTSQVTVRYWDSQEYADASTTVQDIALSRQQGTTIGISKDYPGISSATLAAKVAMRDLNTVSTPLVACTLKTKRELAEHYTMGSTFVMSWPRLGITEMAVRVVKIDYGTETKPEITMDVVQDIFRLGDTTYAPPPPSEWEPPVNEPVASPYRQHITAPYREVVQILGSATSTLDPDAEFILSTPIKPSSDAMAAEWWNDQASGTLAYRGDADFSPYLVLDADLDHMTEDFSFVIAQDLGMLEVGEIGQIGNEIVVIKAVDPVAGTITVGRGCCDTVPETHSAGDYLVFFDQFAAGGENEYTAGDQIRTRFLTQTLNGTLDYDLAPQDVTTLVKRFDTPYPAGNVKLNGEYYPPLVEGTIALTWANRDRLLMEDKVYDFTAGDLGLETGVTYDLEIRNIDTNSVLHSATGIDVTTYDFAPTESAFNCRVTLTAKRDDGVSNFTSYVHETWSVDVLAVTTQPANAVVAEGVDALFVSDASGWGQPTDTVAWEEYVGGDWQPVVGASNKNLIVADTTVADDGRQFRAAYFRGVDAKSVYSTTAWLYIFEGGEPLPTYWTNAPIINGDAETLDLTGWTITVGTPRAATQLSENIFMGGAELNSAMEQIIDLEPSYGDTLANESMRARIEWTHGSHTKADQATINIVAYDKNANEISRTANPQQVMPAWQTRQVEHDLPAGTFKLGILCEWLRKSGTDSNGYLDNIVVSYKKAFTQIVLQDDFFNPPIDLTGGWNYTNARPDVSFNNSETCYPLYGTTMIVSEPQATANAYYDIDVSTLAGQIDAGGVEFGMIFGLTKTHDSTSDTINVAYIYLDESDVELSRDETGAIQPTTGTGQNDFKEWNLIHTLPVGTRKLRINGDWTRPSDTISDIQWHFQSASFGWVDGYEPPVDPSVAVNHENLLVNGDFEMGDFTGWTVDQGTGQGIVTAVESVSTGYQASTYFLKVVAQSSADFIMHQIVELNANQIAAVKQGGALVDINFNVRNPKNNSVYSSPDRAQIVLTFLDENDATVGTHATMWLWGRYKWTVWSSMKDEDISVPSGTVKVKCQMVHDRRNNWAIFALDPIVLSFHNGTAKTGSMITNGNFETGDLTGWTVTSGLASSFNVTSGNTNEGFAPIEGTYRAGYSGDEPPTLWIENDIDPSSVGLTFQDFVNNNWTLEVDLWAISADQGYSSSDVIQAVLIEVDDVGGETLTTSDTFACYDERNPYGDWEHYIAHYKIAPTTVSARLRLVIWRAGENWGTASIDAVRVRALKFDVPRTVVR